MVSRADGSSFFQGPMVLLVILAAFVVIVTTHTADLFTGIQIH
jgi:hypothetical protein